MNKYSILVTALLLTELCASQSATKNSTTPSPVLLIPCTNCQLVAATAAASPDLSTLDRGISTISPTASYVVFTAYSITSEYSSNGICVTTSGSSVPVSPPYSLSRPASIPASDFEQNAGFSFANYLGFSACIPQVATSTGAPSPGNSTEKPVPDSRHHGLDERAKIGIGTTIPVVVTALLLLALLLWRRSRKIKETNVPKAEHMVLEDNQPYLQQKPELDAQEKRKYELDAEERRYELDGGSRVQEISDRIDNASPSSYVLQELRGEEHSRELGVP